MIPVIRIGISATLPSCGEEKLKHLLFVNVLGVINNL